MAKQIAIKVMGTDDDQDPIDVNLQPGQTAGEVLSGLGLQAMKHALTQLVEECPGQGVVTDCPILEPLTMEERVWHAAKNS